VVKPKIGLLFVKVVYDMRLFWSKNHIVNRDEIVCFDNIFQLYQTLILVNDDVLIVMYLVSHEHCTILLYIIL